MKLDPARAKAPDHSVELRSRCRDEIRFLGAELGEVILRFAGTDAFDCIEEIRRLARARREGVEPVETLRDRIARLDAAEIDTVINALSCFLDLANLAEDRQRVRVLRGRRRAAHPEPSPESIGAALGTLVERGGSAAELASLADQLEIELVLTAHPTEAKRHTSRLTLRRVREDLAELDREDLLPSERELLRGRLRAHMACFWETETLRASRPQVLDEVRRALRVADTLWEVVPELSREFRSSLRRHGATPSIRPFLRFGSWIGSDRDGHPLVTADVTRTTLALHREEALRRQLEQCSLLLEVLSLSSHRHAVSERLRESLDVAVERWPESRPRMERWSPHELYRRWLAIIQFRLERTALAAPGSPRPEGAYGHSDELVADLEIIADSLERSGHHELADGDVRDWIVRAATFGFHLYRVDVRYHATQLHETVAELGASLGLPPSYSRLGEAERQAFLLGQAGQMPRANPNRPELTARTEDLLALFDLLRQARSAYGPECLGTVIVSGTSAPSDLLALIWLEGVSSRLAGSGGAAMELPLVPLFETIADLERSPHVLDQLLSLPAYRAHIERSGGRQVCMLGYSDSTKDGGYLCASWKLYRAERELSDVGKRHGVELVFFHGRGGALGRGGGPAARGILSLPRGSCQGRLRITEQGEVLAERYDDPQIAFRHLEQVTWASLLLAGHFDEAEPAPEWVGLMEKMSAESLRAYRGLLEDDAFLEYFRCATPIEVIENLPIGSRPSRRSADRGLETLRAIPYTFAWMQCRHLLTALHGLGAAFRVLTDDERRLLRVLVRDWPFFRSTMENAELAIAKFDASVAHEYSLLLDDADERERIWGTIHADYLDASQGVLAALGQHEVLESIPWLRRSIAYRNRYIDPLNLVQIELLRRWRRALADDGRDAEETRGLEELLRLSVSGVAAGMRTTG